MKVSLAAITGDNWVECARLELPEHQKGLVAPNVESLAEWHFNPHFIGRSIRYGDETAGFVMYCPGIEKGEEDLYWLFRFMIAEPFQGRGIGSQALALVIEEIWNFGRDIIKVMYSPGNAVAEHLYARAGFKPIGVLDDGDVVAQLCRETTEVGASGDSVDS